MLLICLSNQATLTATSVYNDRPFGQCGAFTTKQTSQNYCCSSLVEWLSLVSFSFPNGSSFPNGRFKWSGLCPEEWRVAVNRCLAQLWQENTTCLQKGKNLVVVISARLDSSQARFPATRLGTPHYQPSIVAGYCTAQMDVFCYMDPV